MALDVSRQQWRRVHAGESQWQQWQRWQQLGQQQQQHQPSSLPRSGRLVRCAHAPAHPLPQAYAFQARLAWQAALLLLPAVVALPLRSSPAICQRLIETGPGFRDSLARLYRWVATTQ